jgi:6-phosphogluconolactonase
MPNRRIFSAVLFLTLLSITSGLDAQRAPHLLVHVGTYTSGESEGIYSFILDLSAGELVPHGEVTRTDNPSFLAMHPNHKYLYAVNESSTFQGQPGGGVTAFAVDRASGGLTMLNQKLSGGAAPCHLVVDATGQNVLVANYTGGSLASLRIESDGSLGITSSFIQHTGSSLHARQASPHAHSIDMDYANRFAICSDLGLDKVLLYRFSPRRGKLVAAGSVDTAPGAGPRHFALHPSGRFGYGINEIDLTVTTYQYRAARGSLHAMQTLSTLPPGEQRQEGMSTAEIYCHPSGRFVYGSNRGHDTIVVYSVDQQTGKLTYVENESTVGKTPRSFGIDPTGNFLLAANQASNNILIFRIDQQTGELEYTGHGVDCPTPVCIIFTFAPSGQQ